MVQLLALKNLQQNTDKYSKQNKQDHFYYYEIFYANPFIFYRLLTSKPKLPKVSDNLFARKHHLPLIREPHAYNILGALILLSNSLLHLHSRKIYNLCILFVNLNVPVHCASSGLISFSST